MIEIKKAEDISEQCFENKLEAFVLTDDGRFAVCCAYKLEGDELVIHDIRGETEDKLFLDAVIRATASYALGRGAVKAVCRNRELFDKLISLKFVRDGEKVTAGLDLLLKHNCCGEG